MNTKAGRNGFLLSVLLFGCSAWVRAAEPTLTWFGHSAFEFTTRTGQVILIDPWLTNPKAPKNITFKHVEAILITHGHFDHVGEAFELAKKYNAPIIASYELTEIAKKKGVTTVMPINASGSQHVNDVTITAVPALHSSGYQDGDVTLYAGEPLGFVVAEDGVPVFYHAGDTGVFSDMGLISEVYHPSIALLPIGGVFTMKPSEAAYAGRALQVHTIIPMHYGTFPALTGTPEQLRTELKRLGLATTVREMVPGKAVTLKELGRS
jgi:L-ascorbate metabolism protein UlaG (beta-lactamase superfamily)